MPNKKRLVELRIPSTFGYEKVAMAVVVAMAARVGISGEKANGLRTAVAEACINAIEYGNCQNPALPVVVTMSLTTRHLIIDVQDRARGETRPQLGGAVTVELPDPRSGPHANMGLFLIQNLVDNVKILCRPNGTHVQMAMRLPDRVAD